jgi:hypothetical protein
VVLAALIVALIVGGPGRIDRQAAWLQVLTAVLIGVITCVNAGSSARLVYAIIKAEPLTNNANILLVSGGVIWLTNVIGFGLWYWDLDRGGAAARALGTGSSPAFLFPEMSNPRLVRDGWYPSFVDYLHHSFSTAMAFSPTDVSAIKPWAKLMMMAEEAISLVVGILVVPRAANIPKQGRRPATAHRVPVDQALPGQLDPAKIACPAVLFSRQSALEAAVAAWRQHSPDGSDHATSAGAVARGRTLSSGPRVRRAGYAGNVSARARTAARTS